MRKNLLLLWVVGGIATGQVTAQTQTVTNGSAITPVGFTGKSCTYNWVNNQPSIGLPASGTGNIASFTAVNNTSNPVVATITATPVSTVFAYLPNLQDNTVSVVNTVSNSVVATIPVGADPGSVSVTPDGSKVYIGNALSSNVSVINTATNAVIATIPMGSPAHGVVVNHAGTMVYVSTDNGVKCIDIATNTVVKTIGDPANLDGIAIDPSDKYVYVANNTVYTNVVQIDVVDNNSTFVGTGITPNNVAVTPDGSRIYATSGETLVWVIDVVTRMTIATIAVGGNTEAAAVSPDGKTVYISDYSDGTISVINTATNTVTGTIACGKGAAGINISADGTVLYVATTNGLVAISTATFAILSTTPVGATPLSYGNFLTPPTTCNSTPVTFTITVNPTPKLTVGTAAGYISACASTPSASPAIQQFRVSGTGVTGNVTATAPAGFEVSLALTGGFANSVTLTPSGNAINNQVVYVRSAASAPPGNISGNVTLTGGGVTEQTIAVNGFISTPATVGQTPNQIVINGTPTAAVNFTGSGNTFTWVNNTPGIGLPASGTGNIASFTAVNNGTTPILATVSVTTKNAGFAYIGETQSGELTVINTSTNAITDSIMVGDYPYGMWQTPDGGQIYVANFNSNTLSVIATATRTVIATIAVPGGPVGIVGNPDGSTLYVAEENGNSVAVINTATQTLTATIPVGANPKGICMSLDGSTVYVVNRSGNSISVINTATNTVTATIPTGQSPESICVSPDGTKIYEVNENSNNIYVISSATNTVTDSIPVGGGPHNLVISPDGSTIYTANQADNTVSMVNVASGKVIATIPAGSLPDGIALSPDGSVLYVTNGESNNVSVINTAAHSVIGTIPVDSAPGSLGNFVSNGGCPSQIMTFTITVKPTAPVIVATGDLSPMTTVYGTPSPTDTFTISGSYLTADIVVTPPAGFELSTDGISFISTATVGTTAIVDPTTIYIRLAATAPAGSYSGNITIGSTGAITQNVAVPVSTVTPAPLTITADDTSRSYGQPNPVFTFTYSGFQNNETEAQLTTPPQGSTTATMSSPAGDYPIAPGGAEDPNYTFTYVPGTLKITLAGVYVSIPSAFTPNGDGKNDTWVIKNLSAFVNCKVTVFNRYGQTVFTSTGYGTPWNATQKGSDVPAGTFVYVIDLGNGTKPMTGTVMVVR